MLIKHCHMCCRDYGCFGWPLLPYVGTQRYEAADTNDEDMVLEHRNCCCGSTLAIDLKDPMFAPLFTPYGYSDDERSGP